MKKFFPFFLFILLILSACTPGNNVASKKLADDDKTYNNGDLAVTDDGWLTGDDDIPLGAVLDVSETNLDFGTVYIFEKPRLFSTRYIHVKNLGSAPLTYTSSTLMNDFYFDMDNTTCGINGGTLPAVSSCVYTIIFQPVSVYEPSGTFRIASGDTGKVITIHGKGELIMRGTINADYRDVFFPTTVLGSSSDVTITAKNTGHQDLKFDQELPRNSAFRKIGGTCSATQILKPGATCTLIMRFLPTAFGSFQDRLILTSRDTRNGDIQFIINLNGKGINDGIVSVSSDNISFGLVRVGEFKEKTITVSNAGQLTVKFKTTFPEGFFDAGSTCNVTTFEALKPNTSCEIKIRFQPDRVLVYTDYLRLITNKGIRTQINMIAGGYIDEPLLVQPNDLTFPPTLVGTASLTRNLLLTNTARLPIKFDTVISANFSRIAASTCAAKDMLLQPDESCEIVLTFNPTAWQRYDGTAIFTHKLNIEGTVTATLHGQAITEGILTATPTTLNFGRVQNGTSSVSKSVTITNTGGQQFSFNGRITAPFSVVQGNSTCNMLLNILLPGGSCRYDIIFSPLDLAVYNGTLDMVYNNKTVTVALTGIGATPPDITVTPLTLAFGDVMVGAESDPKTVTITSTGGADAAVSYTVPTGFIERGGTCRQGIILPNGSTCTLSISFAPTNNIAYNPNLTITSSGKIINVALTGTGFRLGELTANPTTLAFGNVLIGATSPSQTIALTNTGDKPVIFTIVMPTDFTIAPATSTCTGTQTLNKGVSCNLEVLFSPRQNITYNSNIFFRYDTGGGINVAVTGRGIKSGELKVTPSELNYNNIILNTTVTLSTTYENIGEDSLTVTTTFPTDVTFFTRNDASTCAATQALAAGDKCILSVDMSAKTEGTITSSITLNILNSLGGQTTQTITLRGVSVTAGNIVVTPANLTFPDTPVVGISGQMPIVVKNTGGTTTAVTATISPDFEFSTSTCLLPNFTLAANGECTINIIFKPSKEGINQGFARFAYGTSSTDVLLSGLGTGATIVIAPNPLVFGEVPINKLSKSMSLTITNTSTTQDFKYSFTLPSTVKFMNATDDNACFQQNVLVKGTSCVLTVSLLLTDIKTYNIDIQILNTVTNTFLPTPMVITATGIDPMRLSLTPTTMIFGATGINTTKQQTLTIKNIGGRKGTFLKTGPDGYTLGGTGTDSCIALQETLNPNQSCTYIVTFGPLSVNSYNATLIFFAEGEEFPLSLQGSGITPNKPLSLSKSSINFLDTPVGYTKVRDVSVTNISDKNVDFKIDVPIDFDMDNNSTCEKFTSLRPDETCNIIVNFKTDEIAEFNDDMNLKYDNESLAINLSARSKKHGYVKYLSDKMDTNSKLSITADNDTLFIYNNELGSLYKYDLQLNLYTPLSLLEPISNNAKMSIKNNNLYIFYDNSTKYYEYNIADNSTKKSQLIVSNILRFDNSTTLLKKDDIFYLVSNDNATNIYRFDELIKSFVNIKNERAYRSTANSKEVLSKAISIEKNKAEYKIFTPSEKVFFINRYERFEKTKILKSVDSKDMKIDNVTIDDNLYKLSTDEIESFYYDGGIFIIDRLGGLSLILQ